MAGEAPKNNIPQVPKQEVILGPIEQLIKLREDFETKQPSFANYTKQKWYVEMKVDDPETQMAYKVVKKKEEKEAHNSPDEYLLDISLLVKDPEWVKQILSQNINVSNGHIGSLIHIDFYTIHITYLTKDWLPKSKIIILKDDGGRKTNIPYWNSTAWSENNLAIRNLTVFKK
ncbi:MAG: hypothetical protein ACD_49C00079G0006 [uncultured bacterium (gcode 4)]|uniref:Uncharacterized protein n=1 Tax=uncultured bacterium (gcode 4) TaxID=1234023 RepID=K2AVE0_9BACT|nr:MAG: hypothetical protein ACD_49C00079G0006 [uncultured bacterium (gcode 4)]